MSYLDDYKARLQAYGNSHGEVIKNSTIQTVNAAFADSPNFRVVTVGVDSLDTRVISGKDFKNKSLLLRPNTLLPIGEMVILDSFKWLVFDFNYDDIFPKADIQLCNDKIRWNERNGTLVEFDCVVNASRYIKYDINANKYDVELLQGGMFVYVVRNDKTVHIKPTQRFIFGSSVYEISGIDDLSFINGNEGLIQFTTRLTTSKPGDDFTNKVADNSALYLSETGGTPDSGSTGGDGLW